MDRLFPWGDARRYNSYSGYFRRLFGGRIQKVTIHAGFTCPNRDGTVGVGGCSFCNNEAFTPSYCRPEKSVRQQIAEGIEFHSRRYKKAAGFLAYFQSFSNTHAPLSELKKIYDEALSCGQVVGLVIGTRPDCVDAEKLDYFAELARKVYVILEYGIESVYDRTLARINRGHTFECARHALEETRKRGIHTGAHFILGLPGESREEMIGYADPINSLALDTVKFHQLQIFRGTAMAEEFVLHPERFPLFGLEEYIGFFSEILVRLRPGLVIERFAGEAPPRYHVGEGWGMVRNETLLSMLERSLEEKDLYQGARFL